jgi:ABC-type phosphate transport system substrate-binding protein
LSSYTYVIVPETSPKASVLKAFLTYAVGPTGQAFGPPAYPALPSAVATSANALIAKIHS